MIAVERSISEAELQSAVDELARWLGWRTFHDHDSRKNRAGLPDLVAVHAKQGRVLFAELKTTRGKLRPDQVAWLEDITNTPAEAYVWRPNDLLDKTIERVLRKKPVTS